jgi:hypothetical protein
LTPIWLHGQKHFLSNRGSGSIIQINYFPHYAILAKREILCKWCSFRV